MLPPTRPRAHLTSLAVAADTLSVLILTGVLGLIGVIGAGPASAHGAEGRMTVTRAQAAPGMSIAVEVGVLYGNDDDLATGATVTAVLTGPGGAQVGPVRLTAPDADSARYAAEITVPAAGAWKVVVTSTDPTATAEATVEVAPQGPPTTGGGPGPGSPAPTTTGGGGPGSTPTVVGPVIQPSGGGPSPVTPSAASESNRNTLILGGVIGLLVGIALAVRAKRRAATEVPAEPLSD